MPTELAAQGLTRGRINSAAGCGCCKSSADPSGARCCFIRTLRRQRCLGRSRCCLRRPWGCSRWSGRLWRSRRWSECLGRGSRWSGRLGRRSRWSGRLGRGSRWSECLRRSSRWSDCLGRRNRWSGRLGRRSRWSDCLGRRSRCSERLGRRWLEVCCCGPPCASWGCEGALWLGRSQGAVLALFHEGIGENVVLAEPRINAFVARRAYGQTSI